MSAWSRDRARALRWRWITGTADEGRPVRDFLLAAFVFSAIPFVIFRPFVGVLLWTWFAFFNPHRFAFGFAYDFPFSEVIAIATAIGLVVSSERKWLPGDALLPVWILWVLWMNVTTLFALSPDDAHEHWARAMKIQLTTLFAIMATTTQKRLTVLLAVISFSVGFYGIKGGMFAIATGGRFQVLGPEESFIEGNTALGLALVMCLPIMWYLSRQAPTMLVRRFVLGCMGLCALAILATQSRGAFLAIIAMSGALWLASGGRLRVLVVLAVVGISIVTFMPDSWAERMHTIRTYDQDESALGRINAWWFAYRLALDHPIVGGGFETFTKDLFMRYAPNPLDFHDAHSIYFEALAEHGFVGLGLFVLLLVLAMRCAAGIRRATRDVPDLKWAWDLSSLLLASLIGYSVGGAFLGLAYFDLYYDLIAAVLVLKGLVRLRLQSLNAPASASGAAVSEGVAPARAPPDWHMSRRR
jgi:probable O-glycosylation ligase (exosortase A-associated)